jgi:hypothetical protein
MTDKILTGVNYILDFINNVPAQSWYVFGTVLGSSAVVIGVVAWIKRRHLKKTAEKLEDQFVYLNLIFWSTLTTLAGFVVSSGADFAAFLPFLGNHMPQIMMISTTTYTLSKKLHAWFVDRQADKKHLADRLHDALNPEPNTAADTLLPAAGSVTLTPAQPNLTVVKKQPEAKLLQF